ncbi:MAG: hypothetical protein CL623_07135 [Arcobacter sp.]|nr:hypothetical protein [Arcobacter sp.]|tara:strand:- start:138 stop:632 length:495 start_codon:yes stop_codon:yes gene_type:complete
MNKFLQRDLATSLTTFLFLVMSITGVLMYFHILDNFTKQMHEIMGLGFVAIVLFHVFYNWKSMKSYFAKKVFLYSAVIIFLISSGFIANSILTPKSNSSKRVIISSVLSAPLSDSLVLFNSNMDLAKVKLEKAGLKMGNAKTFQEIARENRVNPFKIVGIITEK